MINSATITIDLTALKHNLNVVRQYAPKQSVVAMVKANAYGHGLVEVAKALNSAEAFGVARIDEAIKLRESGIKQRILLLDGFKSEEEIQLCSTYQLEPSIHQLWQLELIRNFNLVNPISIWIKIDTGMNRLGISPEEFSNASSLISKIKNIKPDFNCFSHLANADTLDAKTNIQLNQFLNLTKNVSGHLSLANSAGIIAFPNTHFDWVRPGIMLYGISPFMPGYKNKCPKLKPVMTFNAPLIAIKKIKAGEQIGYGGTFTCPNDMTVGVVAVGYGDGYPRHAQNGTPVLINGKLTKLLGRVSMDFITIELTSITAEIGEQATLWGDELSVEQIATYANTIPYHLVTNISARVKRLYK